MKKVILFIAILVALVSCKEIEREQQKSDSGVTKANVTVKTNPDGTTIEQRNIMERLKRDNEIGSIKHLYIISSFTGDVLQYSTVKGKVTSGSKRLSPKTVLGNSYNTAAVESNFVNVGGKDLVTDEVLDDGGAYGESGNYLYWFDAQDNYQQYYPSGGTYLHISDKSLRVKKSNMSLTLD